jgi:hypothetical protein
MLLNRNGNGRGRPQQSGISIDHDDIGFAGHAVGGNGAGLVAKYSSDGLDGQKAHAHAAEDSAPINFVTEKESTHSGAEQLVCENESQPLIVVRNASGVDRDQRPDGAGSE